MKRFGELLIGLGLGLIISTFIHDFTTCDRSHQMESTTKITPSITVTTFEGRCSDTLYTYKKVK